MPGRYSLSNERSGFKTREAAENFQIQSSVEPACSTLRQRDVRVLDPGTRAWGRVYVQPYTQLCRDGKRREFFMSYVGS
jgi:hypothetical protein